MHVRTSVHVYYLLLVRPVVHHHFDENERVCAAMVLDHVDVGVLAPHLLVGVREGEPARFSQAVQSISRGCQPRGHQRGDCAWPIKDLVRAAGMCYTIKHDGRQVSLHPPAVWAADHGLDWAPRQGQGQAAYLCNLLAWSPTE